MLEETCNGLELDKCQVIAPSNYSECVLATLSSEMSIKLIALNRYGPLKSLWDHWVNWSGCVKKLWVLRGLASLVEEEQLAIKLAQL